MSYSLVVGSVDAELVVGQDRLGVPGTCGWNNPWHHLWKMSSWVRIPGRPPYAIPRWSAGWKKRKKVQNAIFLRGNWKSILWIDDILHTALLCPPDREAIFTFSFLQVTGISFSGLDTASEVLASSDWSSSFFMATACSSSRPVLATYLTATPRPAWTDLTWRRPPSRCLKLSPHSSHRNGLTSKTNKETGKCQKYNWQNKKIIILSVTALLVNLTNRISYGNGRT